MSLKAHVDGDKLEHPVLCQDRKDDLPARLVVPVDERKPSCMSLVEELGGLKERVKRVNGEQRWRWDAEFPLDLCRSHAPSQSGRRPRQKRTSRSLTSKALEPEVLDVRGGSFVSLRVVVVLDEMDEVRDGEHAWDDDAVSRER